MKEKMEYHIFNPRDTAFPKEVVLRNQSFEAWFKVWEAVYSKSQTTYKLKSEEFIRQNLATVILIDQKIAAIHLYSFYMLSSLADLNTNYFDFFSKDYVQNLKARGVEKVMSMEFLTVIPEFQKAHLGISLGRVISSLGSRIFGQCDVDAIVAPARRDVKVHEMAYDIGFDCIEEKVMQRGFECDMIACFKGKQKNSEIESVVNLTNQLWDRRIIHGSANSYLQRQELAVGQLEVAA